MLLTCKIDVDGHDVALVHLKEIILDLPQLICHRWRGWADESVKLGERLLHLLLHKGAHLPAGHMLFVPATLQPFYC